MMKNIFRNSILFLFISMNMIAMCASGGLKLPATAMGKPQIFIKADYSSNWANIAKDPQKWGVQSNNLWRVYIDRDDVSAYAEPALNSRELKKLKFLDSYFVAEVRNNFALLFDIKYVQTNLAIPKDAVAIGWVEIDKLLLWTTCPRTRNQICQKAVIAKDPEELNGKKTTPSPYFSSKPGIMKNNGYRATNLEFYFVYKYVDGDALLMLESSIDHPNQIKNMKKYGWMAKGEYTTWNDRTCFEPDFMGNSEIMAAIFEKQYNAREYKDNGITNGIVFFKENLPQKRWAPRRVRFPILDTYDDLTAQVGTIGYAQKDGSIGSGTNCTPEQRQQAQENLDKIQRTLAKINIVFVIDGTGSMKNYYLPLANAIRDAMRQETMKDANIKFGAVVYRNYADNDVIETYDLTNNSTNIAVWLQSRECHSSSSVHHEAMYMGLSTALDKMKWDEDNANFLIHIGDAGNTKVDAKGYSMDGIVEKMVRMNINYIAYQANHPDHVAYVDFRSQTQKIALMNMRKTCGKNYKTRDFKSWKYGFMTIADKTHEFLTHISAYHFLNPGSSESPAELKRLLEDQIVEYKNLSLNNIEALNNMIGTIEDGGAEILSDDVLRWLKSRGIEPNALKNTALKIKGYTSATTKGEEMFIPSIFITRGELNGLINNLSAVSKNSTTNRRKDLQNALTNLVLTYIGQNNASNMTVSEIMEAVTGIKGTLRQDPLGGIKLNQLEDVNKVTDAQIDDYISRLAKDVENLKRKQSDKTCYYTSTNNMQYYYILMEDMPLQDRKN